jgi:hypothetical protein
MLQFGASWKFYSKHSWQASDYANHGYYGFHYPPTTLVWYPSTGGVWVLCFRDGVNSVPQVDPADDNPYIIDPAPERLGRKRKLMLKTMDDYCEAIKEQGGR